MEVRLNDGLRIEEIDGEAIVLDRHGAIAHRVSGDGVEALRLLASGIDDTDIPEHLNRAMDDLVEAGIAQVDRARWTRRKLLVAGGAAFATATVATVALASPAYAATPCSRCDPLMVPDTGQGGQQAACSKEDMQRWEDDPGSLRRRSAMPCWRC